MAGKRTSNEEIAAQGTVEGLGHLMCANITSILEVKDGEVRLKDSADWPHHVAFSVAEISQTWTEHGPNITVRMHDKAAALDTFARHLRLVIKGT